MKDIENMRIGESFYLKRTVAVISARTGRPCEFDEERIDINDLIIAELEKINAEIESRVKINNDLENYDIATGLSMALGILDKHIYELKGE